MQKKAIHDVNRKLHSPISRNKKRLTSHPEIASTSDEPRVQTRDYQCEFSPTIEVLSNSNDAASKENINSENEEAESLKMSLQSSEYKQIKKVSKKKSQQVVVTRKRMIMKLAGQPLPIEEDESTIKSTTSILIPPIDTSRIHESGRKISDVEASPGTGLMSDHYTPMVRRYNFNLEL